MNDNNQHNLDKFFKKRLTDNTPAENGWNVPPMSILDDALNAIEPEPTDRKPLIWKSLLAVGLIAISTMIYLVSVQVQSLNEELSTLKQQQSVRINSQPIQSEQTSILSTNEDAVIDRASDTSVNQNRDQVKNQTTTNNETKIKKSSITTNRYPTPAFTKQVDMSNTPVNRANAINASSSTRTVVSNKTQQQAATQENRAISTVTKATPSLITPQNETQGPITLLPSNPSLLSYTSAQLSIEQPEIIAEDSKRQYSIYMLSGLTMNNYQMMGEESTDYNLSQYHEYCPGYLAEVGISTQVADRWNLFSSIEYEKWTNRSVFLKDIVFDENNIEVDEYGVQTYRDMIDVATPASTTQHLMEFQFRSNDMEDGCAMVNNTTVIDSYQSIGISLGLSYDIIQQSRFSMSAYIQSTLRSTFIANQNLTTELYNENIMMGESTIDYNIEDQLTSRVASAAVGSQLSYRLSPKFDLLLNVDYARDLSPINLSTATSTDQAYRNRFFIGTGLAYRL